MVEEECDDRLARERQSPKPPETIAGRLAYMAAFVRC
jgi:hypothetical protein